MSDLILPQYIEDERKEAEAYRKMEATVGPRPCPPAPYGVCVWFRKMVLKKRTGAWFCLYCGEDR